MVLTRNIDILFLMVQFYEIQIIENQKQTMGYKLDRETARICHFVSTKCDYNLMRWCKPIFLLLIGSCDLPKSTSNYHNSKCK